MNLLKKILCNLKKKVITTSADKIQYKEVSTSEVNSNTDQTNLAVNLPEDFEEKISKSVIRKSINEMEKLHQCNGAFGDTEFTAQANTDIKQIIPSNKENLLAQNKTVNEAASNNSNKNDEDNFLSLDEFDKLFMNKNNKTNTTNTSLSEIIDYLDIKEQNRNNTPENILQTISGTCLDDEEIEIINDTLMTEDSDDESDKNYGTGLNLVKNNIKDSVVTIDDANNSMTFNKTIDEGVNKNDNSKNETKYEIEKLDESKALIEVANFPENQNSGDLDLFQDIVLDLDANPYACRNIEYSENSTLRDQRPITTKETEYIVELARTYILSNNELKMDCVETPELDSNGSFKTSNNTADEVMLEKNNIDDILSSTLEDKVDVFSKILNSCDCKQISKIAIDDSRDTFSSKKGKDELLEGNKVDDLKCAMHNEHLCIDVLSSDEENEIKITQNSKLNSKGPRNINNKSFIDKNVLNRDKESIELKDKVDHFTIIISSDEEDEEMHNLSSRNINKSSNINVTTVTPLNTNSPLSVNKTNPKSKIHKKPHISNIREISHKTYFKRNLKGTAKFTQRFSEAIRCTFVTSGDTPRPIYGYKYINNSAKNALENRTNNNNSILLRQNRNVNNTNVVTNGIPVNNVRKFNTKSSTAVNETVTQYIMTEYTSQNKISSTNNNMQIVSTGTMIESTETDITCLNRTKNITQLTPQCLNKLTDKVTDIARTLIGNNKTNSENKAEKQIRNDNIHSTYETIKESTEVQKQEVNNDRENTNSKENDKKLEPDNKENLYSEQRKMNTVENTASISGRENIVKDETENMTIDAAKCDLNTVIGNGVVRTDDSKVNEINAEVHGNNNTTQLNNAVNAVHKIISTAINTDIRNTDKNLSDLKDDASDSDYHSSDFEFITEDEAKVDLLVNKTIDNKDAVVIKWWNRVRNPTISTFPSNSQNRHTIPEGDEFLNLFQDNANHEYNLNIRFQEYKHVRPLRQPEQFQRAGFNLRLRRPSSDEESPEVARTRRRIIEMHPVENKRGCQRRH